jgi:hypothetical protein
MGWPGTLTLGSMAFRLSLAFGVLVLGAGVFADAAVYKWKDAQGRTHYSDAKPATGIEYEEVSERLRESVSIYTTDGGGADTDSDADDDSAAERSADADPKAPFVPTPREVLRPGVVIMKLHQVDYQITRADENRIRREVELIYRRYVEWFKWNPRPARPVTVRVFGSEASFDGYAKKFNREGSRRSFYSPGSREAVVFGTQWTEDTLGVLRHEVSHAIVDMELRSAPPWIHEGLAEMFESSSAQRGRLSISPNRDWAGTMKLKLRDGSLDSWGSYVDIPYVLWQRGGADVERTYYMIAWSMMSFLVSNTDGKKCLREVIGEGREAGFGAMSRMFERHCGLKRLDREWREWIAKLG